MKIGYIQDSTQEQNTLRQKTSMQTLGVDEVYSDRISVKDTNQPELKNLLDYVRKGDTVVVASFYRYVRYDTSQKQAY